MMSVMVLRASAKALGCGILAAALIAFSAAVPSHALTLEEIANYKGPDRQKMLEDGARKEGKVTIYSGMIVNQALRPMSEAFHKKYPFIDIQYWRGATPQIVQKALAESRAHRMVADVLESTSLAPALMAAKVVAPFHSPETSKYPPELVDPNGYWASSRLSYFGAAYNTNLVKKADVPKTWTDFLDPKWKGKLAWRIGGGDTGAELFITNLRLLWGDDKALDYTKKLAKQDVVGYTQSARQLVNQVMSGEYPIALNIFLHHALISQQKGAPVAPLPIAPIPALNGTVLLAKDAPHPHAAMLLIDFMLSKDGQNTLVKADYFSANPDVPPSPKLRGIVPSVLGMKEQFISPEKVDEMNKTSEEWIKTYFH